MFYRKQLKICAQQQNDQIVRCIQCALLVNVVTTQKPALNSGYQFRSEYLTTPEYGSIQPVSLWYV